MKKSIKGFRVSDSFNEKFRKNMESENARREEVGDKILNENDCIEYINDYFYSHETDKTNKLRRQEKDAQYYASITKTLVEKYFGAISDEMEYLAERVSDVEIVMRLILLSEGVLDDDVDYNPAGVVSRIKADEESIRRIKKIYNQQRPKTELFSYENESEKEMEEEEDDRVFY